MRSATDLSHEHIYQVFDMLDVDHSGLLDFDEFYLLICILIAIRVSLLDDKIYSDCSSMYLIVTISFHHSQHTSNTRKNMSCAS